MRFELVTLGDYLSLQKGISYTSSNLVDNSDTGLLTINAFTLGGGYKPNSEKPFGGNIEKEFLLSDGDVLVAMTEQDSGLLASPLVVKIGNTSFERLTFSLDVGRFMKKKEGLEPRFVFNLLRIPAIRNRAAYGDSGSTVQRLPYEALYEQKLPKPTLEIQRKIINFIDMIDEKIFTNNALSKTLEEIAQTIFKSWFIDFDPVKAKMNGEKPIGMDDETAALFPDSFEESELGLIPKGWEVKCASELFEVGIGRTPPRKEPEWFCGGSDGVPWVSIRDMGTFETYSHDTNEALTLDAVNRFKVPLVPENTVLMSFKLTVGKLCITDRDLVTNEAIAHFRITDKSPIETFYTYLWLSNIEMGNLDSTSSIGTATNSGVIKQIKFLVPTKRLLDSFLNTVNPVFHELKALRRQSSNLIQIRDSLLPRLISGELQIPEEMLAS
jgi:type I restriction enzyme S subunit